MIIIGEKINGTRKQVGDAIAERNSGFIKDLAIRQVNAGANYLDINAGTEPGQEPEDIAWLVNTVLEVTDVTLCIDSVNSGALLAGINTAKKTPMINSLSGEKTRIDHVLPLACEHQTELVVLALDDKGIPKTMEERLKIVRRLVKMTREGDLPDNKLYIDPIITSISTDIESGNIAFNTIRQIKEEFPEVHITAGLSNISFGLPFRSNINKAFAVLAIASGMDSAIIDPEDVYLRSILYAAELMLGMDKFCRNYTRAFRNGIIGDPGQWK